MSEIVSRMLGILVGWNWPAIIQALVSIWLATVATLALRTWKRQSQAQKQTDFLDNLTDSIHEFISQMAAPITMVKFIKIYIQSHAEPGQVDNRLRTPGSIAYIQRRGKDDSKRLGELLEKSMPALSKVSLLSSQGSSIRI